MGQRWALTGYLSDDCLVWGAHGLTLPREAKGCSQSRVETPGFQQSWNVGTELVSFGYRAALRTGFQMTLIQLAQAYAAIANKGTIYKPQIVKEIEIPTALWFFVLYRDCLRVEAKQSTWDALAE